MKIYNIRYGFATNSSSTHSVIICKDAKDDDILHQEFGWNWFTAASEQAKKEYLAQQLKLNLNLPDQYSESIAKDWLDVKLDPTGYLDHDSKWYFPLNWDEKGINKRFFDEFKEFILRDDIVILGGNDNDGISHELSGNEQVDIPLPSKSRGTWVTKRNNDYWILFNRTTGTKIRFSITDSFNAPTKAITPELVDIKITDLCPFHCEFCYQSSTISGKHGNKENILKFILELGKLTVAEIAIGGGEPTLHPDLKEIVERARWFNIVPNVTTKRLDWMYDNTMREWMLRLCGGIGFSPSTTKDIQELAEVTEEKSKFTIQCVVGSHAIETTMEWINAAMKYEFDVLLLGWKQVGRGATSMKYGTHEEWEEMFRKEFIEWPKVGVDTAFAKEFKPMLDDMKIPRHRYSLEEGKFSMYYDAVTNMVGASSYCENMLPLKNISAKEITRIFKKF